MHHILLPTGSENVSHFPKGRVGVGGVGLRYGNIGDLWNVSALEVEGFIRFLMENNFKKRQEHALKQRITS